MTRGRRLAGTMPYAACFTFGSEDRKYSVSTSTVKNEKKPDRTALPAPRTPPAMPLMKLPSVTRFCSSAWSLSATW